MYLFPCKKGYKKERANRPTVISMLGLGDISAGGSRSEHLLHKQEDLHSNSRHSHKMSSMAHKMAGTCWLPTIELQGQ